VKKGNIITIHFLKSSWSECSYFLYFLLYKSSILHIIVVDHLHGSLFVIVFYLNF